MKTYWVIITWIVIYPMATAIHPLNNWGMGPVSQKSRNFSGLGPDTRKSRNFSGVFRVTQFSLYLQNDGVSRHETWQLLWFSIPLKHIKGPASQNKRVGVLGMALRVRNVFGTLKKRSPTSDCIIPFISSQRRGSKPSNNAILWVFHSLKTR